jgi:uncharacterized protein (DUF1684 family)
MKETSLDEVNSGSQSGVKSRCFKHIRAPLERLFILFKDATSGKETYGAGRYLDLEAERDHTPDGRWILDFNRAYNPWCVYSKDYTCPLVPRENWLEVAIPAGEKDYPLKK